MKKAIGVTILILVVAVIIYFLFYSYKGGSYLRNINFTSETHPHKIISIRKIDSLTAALNYHFTIKNKIVHTISQDSLKIPIKAENPSG